MAKKAEKKDLQQKHDETYEKLKRATEFKSLDNPDVKREVQKIVADHAGETLPDDGED